MGGFVCKKPMFQEKHPHPQQQWVGKVKFLKQKKKAILTELERKVAFFYDQHQQCYKSTNTVSLAPKKVQILYIKKVDTVN